MSYSYLLAQDCYAFTLQFSSFQIRILMSDLYAFEHICGMKTDHTKFDVIVLFIVWIDRFQSKDCNVENYDKWNLFLISLTIV